MAGEEKSPSFSTSGREDPRLYQALGRAIKVLRAERGLSRRELAEQAEVSYPYLSEIENGKKRPSSKAVVAVAAALGVRASQLLETAESLLEVVSSTQPSVLPQAEEVPPGGVEGSPKRLRSEPVPGGRIAQTPPPASSLPPAAPERSRPRTPWFGAMTVDLESEEPYEVVNFERVELPASRAALMARLDELTPLLSDRDLERVLDLVERLLHS